MPSVWHPFISQRDLEDLFCRDRIDFTFSIFASLYRNLSLFRRDDVINYFSVHVPDTRIRWSKKEKNVINRQLNGFSSGHF